MKSKILILAAAVLLPASAFAEKTAYLGVATQEASAALKEQLNVSHGVVVSDVRADGPAAAVLKKHDIITKLGDQKLMNPAQLTELMKTHRKGEKVKVAFVRKGKTETAEIVLGEREMKKESVTANSFFPGINLTDPKTKIRGFDFSTGEGGKNAGSGISIRVNGEEITIGDTEKMTMDIEKALKEAQKIIKIDAGNIPNVKISEDGNSVSVSASSGGGSSSSSSATSTVWNDNGTTYQITTKDGDRVVKITKDGKTIFEGPANTEAENANIPEEHRKKIEEIQGKVRVIKKRDVKKEKRTEKKDQ